VDKKGFFQHNIIKKRKKLESKVGRNYDCDISRNQNRERKNKTNKTETETDRWRIIFLCLCMLCINQILF